MVKEIRSVTDTKMEKLTLSILEAGKALGIGRSAAYEAARTGQIPTIRIGKRLLVPIVALERLLGGAGGGRDPQGSQQISTNSSGSSRAMPKARVPAANYVPVANSEDKGSCTQGSKTRADAAESTEVAP